MWRNAGCARGRRDGVRDTANSHWNGISSVRIAWNCRPGERCARNGLIARTGICRPHHMWKAVVMAGVSLAVSVNSVLELVGIVGCPWRVFIVLLLGRQSNLSQARQGKRKLLR